MGLPASAPPAPERARHSGLRKRATRAAPAGIGLGLRWAFLDEAQFAPLPESLAFFEFSPENYMRRGGHYLQALQRVARRRPLSSHGLMLNLGGVDPIDEDYLRRLRSLLDAFDLPAHSDHLCWTAQGGRQLHELMPLGWSAAGLQRCRERLLRVQELLARPLSLENISAYVALDASPKRAHARAMQEAEFMTRLLEGTGAGLLLDLNNAWVNAQNQGFDVRAFLAAMPLEHLTQLHIAGGERRPDFQDLWIDTHAASVPEPVVELMVEIIESNGPLPVLYERDHQIPPFERLLSEVEQLDDAYRGAVARWEAGQPRSVVAPAPPAPRSLDAAESVPASQQSLADFCLRKLDADGSPNSGHPAQLAPRSADVYRRLVRGTLTQPIRDFLPRSAARLGPHFDALLEDFFDAGGSDSPYLRDVPADFAAFATYRLPDDLSYVHELMSLELVAYQVAAAPADPDRPPSGAVQLNRGLRVEPSARLCSGAFAVHELPADPADRSLPPQRPTHLLVYRDAQLELHYLELSDFAFRLVDTLMDGATLEAAVRVAAKRRAGAIEADDLARCEAVLSDLGARGVLRGPSA